MIAIYKNIIISDNSSHNDGDCRARASGHSACATRPRAEPSGPCVRRFTWRGLLHVLLSMILQ